jgi:hypothetical protein
MANKDGSKSGGRQRGTPNRSTSARHEAMARVNEALNQLGEDTLSGMKLLQQVIRSPDCPLDVRIQCSGLLLKHELPLEREQQYVVCMPLPLAEGTADEQMKEWKERYCKEMPNATPEQRDYHEQLASQIIDKHKALGHSKDAAAPWLNPDDPT